MFCSDCRNYVQITASSRIRNSPAKIVEGRPGRNRGVPGLFENPFHEVRDGGLAAEGDQNMTIAKHCRDRGKLGANGRILLIYVV